MMFRGKETLACEKSDQGYPRQSGKTSELLPSVCSPPPILNLTLGLNERLSHDPLLEYYGSEIILRMANLS